MSTAPAISPAASAPGARSRPPWLRVDRRWLVFGLLTVYVVVLAIRLRNTASPDEALSINAGYAHLNHWADAHVALGDPAYGSGLQVLYPVLAAVLDTLGGLYLVRVFSLACIVAAALLLHHTARHLWGHRAGLLTAAAFLLSGPVVYDGWSGSPDAPAIALIALGLWLAFTRRGIPSAVLIGMVLILAVLTKYAVVLIVPVVTIVLFVGGITGVRRAAIATGVFAGASGVAWSVWGTDLIRDIASTTVHRSPMPASTGHFVGLLADHLAFVWLLAALALVLMFRTGDRRLSLLGTGLVMASLTIPIAQMATGEASSFEEHLAYSTLFLALPIGWGLARVSTYPLMVTPVVVTVLIMALFPLVRADAMYRWPNAAGVVAAVEYDPEPGRYLASDAAALDYHTRSIPGITWDEASALYTLSADGIRAAIADRRYERIILHVSVSDVDAPDGRGTALADAMAASSAYTLAFEPIPGSAGPGDEWLVYERR